MTKETIVFLVLIVVFLFHTLIVEPNALSVTKYTIKDSQLAGIRIAFLSDLHLKRNDYGRLNKIVKLTKKQNPDLVLLGGDYVRGQDYSKAMDMNVVASKMTLIGAPVYAILGEADWWTDGKKIAQAFVSNRIHVLENTSKRIRIKSRNLDIIGIADATTRQPNIDLAFRRTVKPRIVVTHNPDIYYDIINDVSLILAGHTHGGQFVIPFMTPLFVPSKFGGEFASGLIKNSNNKMIISKGIGTTGIPLRLNCRPEIVIVEFVR